MPRGCQKRPFRRSLTNGPSRSASVAVPVGGWWRRLTDAPGGASLTPLPRCRAHPSCRGPRRTSATVPRARPEAPGQRSPPSSPARRSTRRSVSVRLQRVPARPAGRVSRMLAAIEHAPHEQRRRLAAANDQHTCGSAALRHAAQRRLSAARQAARPSLTMPAHRQRTAASSDAAWESRGRRRAAGLSWATTQALINTLSHAVTSRSVAVLPTVLLLRCCATCVVKRGAHRGGRCAPRATCPLSQCTLALAGARGKNAPVTTRSSCARAVARCSPSLACVRPCMCA